MFALACCCKFARVKSAPWRALRAHEQTQVCRLSGVAEVGSNQEGDIEQVQTNVLIAPHCAK